MTPASKRFRVAFSFSGEKRDFVAQVADFFLSALAKMRSSTTSFTRRSLHGVT